MPGSLLALKLSRTDSSTPWGFRLEGGVDMGHALNIKSVVPGSVAHQIGLCPGDIIIRINRNDTRFMKHEEAKMEIIRSGNDFDIVVERSSPGGAPMEIQPMSVRVESVTSSYNSQYCHETRDFSKNLQVSQGGVNNISTATESHNVDYQHVSQTAPMPGQAVIGKTAEGRFQRLAATGYNNPMGLYSRQNTDSSFAESVAAAGMTPGFMRQPMKTSSLGGTLRCDACNELIRGTMVRVRNQIPMHPECLKCVKCGIGLRKVGYFSINDSLYCELHAKQAAPPPERGMKPVIVYK